jgi:hypothetical protein
MVEEMNEDIVIFDGFKEVSYSDLIFGSATMELAI